MPKMGSPFTITIDAKDTVGIQKSMNMAFEYVDQLNMVFSSYITSSEVSLINASPSQIWLPISKDMHYLLTKSQAACNSSNGAFDITIGAVVDIWKNSKRKGTVNVDSIQFYKKFCGCDVYSIDTIEHKIFKKNNHFKFDFGGIAKGYIADLVSNLLDRLDYPRHLIDAGGDLVVGDAPTDAEGWMISIEQPMSNESNGSIVVLSNKAIATSGATYQNFDYRDKKVSHIIDPQKGIGVRIDQNTTIIANTGTDADWLATACSVLGYRHSKKLIKKYEDSSIIWCEGSKFKKAGAKIRYYK